MINFIVNINGKFSGMLLSLLTLFKRILVVIYLTREDGEFVLSAALREQVVMGVLSLLPVGWKVILMS